MGQRASHTGDVIFEDCRIPAEFLVGEENQGFFYAMKMLEHSRPTVGAAAVGVARAAYEYALDYAKERNQFGKPIFHHQSISFLLADMRRTHPGPPARRPATPGSGRHRSRSARRRPERRSTGGGKSALRTGSAP